MKALVIGAGTAGAATAMALHEMGAECSVREARGEGNVPETGYLTIMPNGMDALAELAAEHSITDCSIPSRTLEVRDSRNAVIGERSLTAHHTPRTLTQASLCRALREEVSHRGIDIAYGTRLTSARADPDGVVAEFSDGHEERADVMIGAEGVRSLTRRLIDPKAPDPRYTGLNIVYGYTHHSVPDPAPPEMARMIYGNGGFFGYKVGVDGGTWWFARLQRPATSSAELRRMTGADWHSRAQAAFAGEVIPAPGVIAATEPQDVLGLQAWDIPSLPAWHNDRMLVVGDAAHAASPAAGEGASFALEDATTLALCLRTGSDIPAAFAEFEAQRRARAEHLVTASADHADTDEERKAADERKAKNS